MMAEPKRLGAKVRTRSNQESSIIKLKAAFKPKAKVKTSRQRSPVMKIERRRTVRFEYQSGLSDVKDISRNLDSVSILVDKLHSQANRSTITSVPPVLPEYRPSPVPRRKAKSPQDTLNTSVASLMSSTAETLYRRRWEESPIPIVKETKSTVVRKTRQLIREALPLLRT